MTISHYARATLEDMFHEEEIGDIIGELAEHCVQTKHSVRDEFVPFWESLAKALRAAKQVTVSVSEQNSEAILADQSEEANKS